MALSEQSCPVPALSHTGVQAREAAQLEHKPPLEPRASVPSTEGLRPQAEWEQQLPQSRNIPEMCGTELFPQLEPD